jgi:hypothetical protein|tara:strand:+ start:340 stop:546 length:207 start_codon:yes stop_codon:yes gene_type:complete
MGILRAVIFGAVAVFPALIFGVVSYMILGGELKSPSPSDFMYGPCYGIPFATITIAFIIGLKDDVGVE